jgi:hypothetical protein
MPQVSDEEAQALQDKISRASECKGTGHAGYLTLLDEMRKLHLSKCADYGTGADPLANLRASAEVGIEPWRATWLRALDKVQRIKSYCLNGRLANEGVEDSFLDLASYCLLAVILFREEQRGKDDSP